jgi:hypothetical protein
VHFYLFLVYFVKSGPQNATDSNKIIIIFIKIDERLSQAARPKKTLLKHLKLKVKQTKY